jgi:transposase
LSDIDALVHHDLVPHGQNVIGHFYVQDVQRLRTALRRKRQDNGFCYHDNAPCDTSLVVQQFVAEENIAVYTQPPHSPDLAPSYFSVLATLKMDLKGTLFAVTEDIKFNATAELRTIPKEPFLQYFQQWQDQGRSVCACALAGVLLLR